MEVAVLEKIGLEKAEAEVYLAMLKNGALTATAISRETKIERTLVYRIVEKLIDKGIANFIIENKVKKFSAASPKQLLLELQEKENELKKHLPLLMGFSKEKRQEPKIEIYRGENVARILAKEILGQGRDYDLIMGKKIPGMEEYFEYFMKAIEEANIYERLLVEEGMVIVKSKNTKIRYLPKNYELSATTGVAGDKVGMLMLSKPLNAIVIEDKGLANTFRSYFELLWTVAATREKKG